MNLKYICAQPAVTYYEWQVEVMINNFIKHGVKAEDIIILCSLQSETIPDNWKKLQNHFSEVNFHFYKDTRINKSYIPSIYFNLLSSYFEEFPEMIDENIFLHDSDIVFTKQPELQWAQKSNTWYLSDTVSYIGYDYIKEKGDHIYESMCDIIGIDPLIPKLMNRHSGGAQYIVSGEGAEFWKKVEHDSVRLYTYFCKEEPNHKKKHEYDYPLQKWTDGMWSFLWNAWLAGHPTEIRKELDFGWSTNPVSDIEKHWILHNAGVTQDSKRLFFKGDYINKLPYNEDLDIDPTRASHYYWMQIQETKLNSCLV
jgi:hypothetical protein